MAKKIIRRGARYGALNSVSGNRVNYSLEGARRRAVEAEPTFWNGGGDEDGVAGEELDRWGRRCCRPCRRCDGSVGGRRTAPTDCPECETCAGWPLYYTGPCGVVSDVGCAGPCANTMPITASAQFVAIAPVTVSEDGNINFDFETGDDELFREVNGRVRVAYPGRYLVIYTAQIPGNADVCTRILVTLDDERIFGSEIFIADGRCQYTRTYTASALIDVARGQEIALESTRPFTIADEFSELPIFTMTIVRVG